MSGTRMRLQHALVLSVTVANGIMSSCTPADSVRATPTVEEPRVREARPASTPGTTFGREPAADESVSPVRSAPPEPVVAYRVAASWLSALAVADTLTLGKLSGPDFRVTGFTVRPEVAASCGNEHAEMSQAVMRADAQLNAAKVLECLVSDPILIGSVPELPAERWSERLSEPDRHGLVGYLKPLDLQALGATRLALPTPLEKYRGGITEQMAGGAGFTFFVTDRGGGRAEGVLILHSIRNELLVSDVFIDEEFRC